MSIDAVDRARFRKHSDNRRAVMSHSAGGNGLGDKTERRDSVTDYACNRMHVRLGIPFVWVGERRDQIVFTGSDKEGALR